MKPDNILHLLSPTDLERILGVTGLENYIPFVTLRVARDEHGLLSFEIVKPLALGINLKADDYLIKSLKGLEKGQWLDLTINADGEPRVTIEGVEYTTGLLRFPMIQAVNNAFYADLATLAGKLRSFLLYSLPNTDKLRADLKASIVRSLDSAFPGTIAAMEGAKTVRVLTPSRFIEVTASIQRIREGVCVLEFDERSIERPVFEELGVAVLRFTHKERPEFSDLGGAIIKAAAETMLLEANTAALIAFLAKLTTWKEAAANQLANLAPKGESDLNEPAAGEFGLHPPSEAALHGGLPNEN